MQIQEYLSSVIEKSKEELNKEFDTSILGFSDFEYINAYLIHKAIEEEKNLFIKFPKKNHKNSFVVPLILTMSFDLLYKNYIDNITTYNVGDILQKDNKLYEIVKNRPNEPTDFTLISKEKGEHGNATYSANKKQIKTYFKTTREETTARNQRTKLKKYQNLFETLLEHNSKEVPPTQFKHKSIIVASQDLILELKKFKFEDDSLSNLHKSIPFTYCIQQRNGNIKETSNLPIEPMLYIIPDYSVAKHLFNDEENIDSIVFIGKNKYKENEASIRSDQNEGLFKNVIFIGSEEIEYNNEYLRWEWSMPEIRVFLNIPEPEIDINTVRNNGLTKALNEFIKLVKEIEGDYNIIGELNELIYLAKKSFSIIIPNSESQLFRQIYELENQLINWKKEFIQILEEASVYDFQDDWSDIEYAFNEITNSITDQFIKFEKLSKKNRLKTLIVSKKWENEWIKEMNPKNPQSPFYKMNIINFNNFRVSDIGSYKKCQFLSYYGYSSLQKIWSADKEKYSFILYEEEAEQFQKDLKKLKKEELNILLHQDREKLIGVCFVLPPPVIETETISETIYNLGEKGHQSYKERETKESSFFKITFDDFSEEDVNENSKLLLYCNNQFQQTQTFKLQTGDSIAIYKNLEKNSDKNIIYDIVLENDKDKIFESIESASTFFKQNLNEYCSRNIYSPERLFNELKSKGLTIGNLATFNNWLNKNSSVKFPQNEENIKIVLNFIERGHELSRVIKAKRDFKRIFQSMGRNLSNEVFDYRITGKKGVILTEFSDDQVKAIVEANTPIKTIKSIEKYEPTTNQ